jgi:hypothetical protein
MAELSADESAAVMEHQVVMALMSTQLYDEWLASLLPLAAR